MEKNILSNFLKENGGEIMSFLYDMLTKEEMEEIREHDGYVRGLKEGHASGLKEGLARGVAENQRSIAVNMLTKGMDVSLISDITSLSREDISSLSQAAKLK